MSGTLYDQKQDRRRKRNTIIMSVIILIIAITTGISYVKYNEISQAQKKNSEIAELVREEGYRKCIYTDTLGFRTVGFGHRLTSSELKDKVKCVSPTTAVGLLRQDYNLATASVETRYPWAEGEVKLVLINMTYQMGSNGVSKFKKSLACFKIPDFDCAAAELLDSRWATQTPSRAARLAGRIMSIQ